MKRGEAYHVSREQRALDVLVASAARPAEMLARIVAKRAFTPAGQDSIFYQQRVGKNGKVIMMPKVRTLGDDGATPINAIAEEFRKLGLDELPQLELIRSGKMTIFAPRPLLLNDHDEVRNVAYRMNVGEQYDTTVLSQAPGWLTSFSIRAHIDPSLGHEERVLWNLRDYDNASTAYNLKMALDIALKAMNNELVNGRVGHLLDNTESL